MIDEHEPDSQAFPTTSFTAPMNGQQGGIPPLTHNPNVSQSTMPPPSSHPGSGAQIHNMGSQAQFDAFEGVIDADPFGLTASMHFPTPYSYDASR